MSGRFYYATLTAADRQYLLTIAQGRWKTVGRRFLLSAILPMAVVLPMLLVANLVILANLDEAENIKDVNIPPGIEHFSLLLFAIPIFAILVLVNVVMFIRSIPPVYIDIRRGMKKQLVFIPQPYTIPQSGHYYINTGLPALRFMEVTHEQYTSIDYTRPCYLEVAPLSNIPLGFKTIESIE